MKLPKERTLWNWVITGLGLIIGVAIIGLMSFLNEYLNLVHDDSVRETEFDLKPVSNMIVYYTGKIIAIITGCFTAGAVMKIARPELKKSYLLVIGLIFLFLSLFDLLIYTYPLWYQFFSVLVTVPCVFIGNRMIK